MTPDDALAAVRPWRADGTHLYALTGGAGREDDLLLGGMETEAVASYVALLHNQRIASAVTTGTMNPVLTDITIEQR